MDRQLGVSAFLRNGFAPVGAMQSGIFQHGKIVAVDPGVPKTTCIALGLATLTFAACADTDRSNDLFASAQRTTSRTGDECAPGVAPDADDAPDAVCAGRFDAVVPDLMEDDVASVTRIAPKTIRPLAATGAERPSCAGAEGPGITTCGPTQTENCCRSLDVPGGKAGAVAVETFDLAVYEVTVGRFERFVNAFGGDLRGAAKAGEIPGISPAHAAELPASRGAVDDVMGASCKARSNIEDFGARTWPSPEIPEVVDRLMSDDTDRARDIRLDARPERLRAKPVNCVTYWMAEAFCAWDGGRLPTNDEWRYAAAGGDERRDYPWGAKIAPNKLVTQIGEDFTFPDDFPFFGNGMNAYHIAPPGQKPEGAGRWGHMDLAGNLLEFMADETNPGRGIVRGGSWEGHNPENDRASVNYPFARTYGALGFRCAYGAAPPPPVVVEEKATVQVFRSHNAKSGDYILSLKRGEGAPAYADEGAAFRLFERSPENGRPLYRCEKDGKHHFLANQPDCRGHELLGTLGYVSTVPFEGSLPLYRCHAPKGDDRLTTLKASDCVKRGFEIEGTQGFVTTR